LKQRKQRSEYFALWRANDFAPEQVRECIYRRLLNKPMTLKLLDASREYWLRHGATDWGLVTDAEP
jgi:hypothetical protein